MNIEFYVYLYYVKELFLSFLTCNKHKRKHETEKVINHTTSIENMHELIEKMNYLGENIYDMQGFERLKDISLNDIRMNRLEFKQKNELKDIKRQLKQT